MSCLHVMRLNITKRQGTFIRATKINGVLFTYVSCDLYLCTVKKRLHVRLKKMRKILYALHYMCGGMNIYMCDYKYWKR